VLIWTSSYSNFFEYFQSCGLIHHENATPAGKFLDNLKIGQKILRSSGNITMVIDNLEKNELVKRERNKADRRFFSVHLTDKGCHLINKLFPPHAAVIAQDLAVLSAAEQDTLGRLCKKPGLSGEL
jgi:MarR family 2-MHQ and catechol resistance regulon transcriptional repressor